MVKLYKRGRVWWVRSNLFGICTCRSLRTSDRRVAEELCRAIQVEVLSGGKLKRRSWEEFAGEFELSVSREVRPNTLKHYLFVLDKLGAFLKNRGVIFLTDVTPAEISTFLDSRRQELHPSWKRRMTDGGARAYLRVLHRIFSLAVEREYLPKNPVTTPNRNAVAGRTRPFSQEEITAMLISPYLTDKGYLRAIILLFLHSGLRIGDVIGLRKSDVDGEFLNLRAQKNNKSVRLPICCELREALDAQQTTHNAEQRGSPFLFSTKHGQPIVGLDKHLRRLWKDCGVTGGHAHRFRDTFAVRLLEKGASLYDVAKLLGISAQVVEAHYAPYVKELQERGRRLVSMLSYTAPSVGDEILSSDDGEPVSERKLWTN